MDPLATKRCLRKRKNANDGIPVKDLRSRRIFSAGPASPPGPKILEDREGEYMEKKLESLEKSEKTDLGSCGNVDLCGFAEENGVMVNGDIENLHGSGEKGADITSLKAEDNDKESGKNEVVVDLGVDQIEGLDSSKGVNLHPRRRRVFKAPSSFNYRRMLPFLKDIAKDESGTLNIEIFNAGFEGKFKNLNDEKCNVDAKNVTPKLQSVMEYVNVDKCTNVTGHFDDGKPRNGEKYKVEAQSPSKRQDSDVINNDEAKILGDYTSTNGKLKGVEHSPNGTNGLIEDCVQTTPPDADIFSKRDRDGCGDILGGGISSMGVSNISKSNESPNQKNETISKTKLVLNPCSRRKVFKPLGSVSYRRLLPYLTSVETTNSCDSRIGDQAKPKKDLVADQMSALLDSSKEETPSNGTKLESPFEKTLTANDELNETSSTVRPTYDSADNPSPNLSVRQLSSSNGSSDNVKSFEGEPSISAVPSRPSVNHEPQPTDSTLELSLYEPDGKDRDSMDVENMQLVGTVGMKRSSSIDEASVEPGNHIDVPMRGILKRNPRGCRGLCDCLSCASFRLNAERAFDFSRNQMQDAEEVALELIKELSGIRHMLESSAANANGLAVIQLNQSQVEEACRRALETEKLAKDRLSQMNEDLTIHCKTRSLDRPRVAFSSRYNEEKFTPMR